MKRLLVNVIPSAARNRHRPDRGPSTGRTAIPRLPARNDCRVLLAFLIWATPAAAQQVAACAGPGAAFGVTSYQCASCGIKQSAGTRPQYLFQAEPIVLEAAPGSVLKAGDVIEAVNGEPIMTQTGSDRFTYPQAGQVTLTVRRGGARVQLTASTRGCETKPAKPEDGSKPLIMVDGVAVADMNQLKPGDIDNIEVLKGEAARTLYGELARNGVIVITTKRMSPPKPAARSANDPIFVIDGVVVPTSPPAADTNLTPSGRRFGFAVGCLQGCTRTKASDGTDYYKFDGYPAIVALTPGGAAERAGIRVGDVVTEVDGKSVLTEDGALRFIRGTRTETLQLTVIRDRQSVGYLLKAR
jgi:TonB-dependent SusC/RagA subfamily outer membrane receptor